jgi:nitric oxide reductase subunit B
MMNPKVRAIFLFFLVLCFGVLIFGGYLIKKEKPPIPRIVKTKSGEIIFTKEDIISGQNYYYSRGGQHIGTIWGHGSYLAPDWSADYLHRMGLFIAARYHGLNIQDAVSFSQKDFEALNSITRAELGALVKTEMKTNRYDRSTGELIFTPYQAEAHKVLIQYYTRLFKNGNERMGLQP